MKGSRDTISGGKLIRKSQLPVEASAMFDGDYGPMGGTVKMSRVGLRINSPKDDKIYRRTTSLRKDKSSFSFRQEENKNH